METGYAEHLGFSGMRMFAPSSMRAWLKSPGLQGSTIFPINLQIFLIVADCFGFEEMAFSLEITLTTYPSTTATTSLNAIKTIAPAIKFPTPSTSLGVEVF